MDKALAMESSHTLDARAFFLRLLYEQPHPRGTASRTITDGNEKAEVHHEMSYWNWSLVGATIAFAGLNVVDAWRSRARTRNASYVEAEMHREGEDVRASAETRLQIDYAAVFVLVMMADWLQGPYVFSLCKRVWLLSATHADIGLSRTDHDEFGLQTEIVAQLFVAGFASAGLASLFVGKWRAPPRAERMKVGTFES